MKREFKLDGLFALKVNSGSLYPRIFLTRADAESTNEIICNSMGEIYPVFINS